jgi:hypothetical protein
MGKSSKAVAAEKERRVIELRMSGASYPQICQMVGYKHPQSVYNVVQNYFRRQARTREEIDHYRELQLERLGRMLVTQWPAVNRGEPEAISLSMQIMSRMDVYVGWGQGTVSQSMNVNVGGVAAGTVFVIEGSPKEYASKLEQAATSLGLPPAPKDLSHLDHIIDFPQPADGVVDIPIDADAQDVTRPPETGLEGPGTTNGHLDHPETVTGDYSGPNGNGQSAPIACDTFIRPMTGEDACRTCQQPKNAHR